MKKTRLQAAPAVVGVLRALLLASVPALLLATPAAAQKEQRHIDEHFPIQALQDGERREITFTPNFSLEGHCEVVVEFGRRAVIGTLDLIGPDMGRDRTKVTVGGVAWFNPQPETPGEKVWRFGAFSDSPWLPRTVTIPEIKVQTRPQEFIHIVEASVMLDNFSDVVLNGREGFPCVWYIVLRKRPAEAG